MVQLTLEAFRCGTPGWSNTLSQRKWVFISVLGGVVFNPTFKSATYLLNSLIAGT